MMRLAGLALLLAACLNPLDNPDAKQRCLSHDTLASCAADDACEVATCPNCGKTSFSGCFLHGDPNPFGTCPAIACVEATCSSIDDEATCNTTPGCFAATCPTCGGEAFDGCFDTNDPPPLHCTPVECPADCAKYDNDADCSANPSCYSLFKDAGLCDCATAGCCMTFFQCATGPAVCGTGPSCDNPPMELACGPGYTTGANEAINGCVLGCVHDTLCITN